MSESTLLTDRTGLRRRSVALFVFVLVVVMPFMHTRSEQEASRYSLSAALWDEQTFEVTSYAGILQRDGAVVEGVVYSDKAPLQPVLAAPFYGIYRVIGGDAFSDGTPVDADWGLWWLALWTSAVPAALLAVLMYRWADEIEPTKAMGAALVMTFGTLVFVYATVLFAHVLAALLGLAMFLMVRRRESSRGFLFAAGFVGGCAVLVEYPLALIVFLVSVAGFYLHRWQAWPILAGGVLPASALMFYNWSLFGGPLVFSYQWNVFAGIRDEAAAQLEIFTGPSLERFFHVLVSERGLLIATPVIGLAFAGLYLVWRKGRRVDAVVAAIAFLSMLAIQGSWGNSYAGGAGPRYVIPGLPFLAIGLAAAWRRWRVMAIGTSVISVLTMTAAATTDPHLNSEFSGGMAYWLGLIVNGDMAPTIYTETLGGWGWLLHATSVAGAGWFLYQICQRTETPGGMGVATVESFSTTQRTR